MRYLCFCLLVFLLACDLLPTEPINPKPIIPPVSTISIDPKNSIIERGEESQHKIFVKIDDPDKSISEAVLFLNVLYMLPDGNGLYEPALGYFSNPSITNSIFSTVLTGAQLRKGLATRLNYTIRPEAPVGLYTINIQMFNGSETNPRAVKIENRIGIQNILFEVR